MLIPLRKHLVKKRALKEVLLLNKLTPAFCVCPRFDDPYHSIVKVAVDSTAQPSGYKYHFDNVMKKLSQIREGRFIKSWSQFLFSNNRKLKQSRVDFKERKS